MRKLFSFITCLTFLYNIEATAQCACCSSVGCGDNSGGGSSLVKKGKFLFGLTGRYTTFKPLSSEQLQHYAGADTSFPVYNKSNQVTYIMSLTYGISDRLNVTATLPYNSIANIQIGSPSGDAVIQGTSKGFSNLKISIQYVLFQRKQLNGWEIIPAVGIIAPTGVHNNVGLDGNVFDDQFQPGANAWVPVLGLSGDNTFGKVTLRSSVNYVFANTDPAGNTDASLWNIDASAYLPLYQSGAGKVKGVADSIQACMMRCQSYFVVNAFGGIQCEHIGQDVVAMPDGSKQPNGNIGAFRIYADLGVVANFYQRLFMPVSFALPVYQTFNGYQVKVQWRLNAGLSVLF